MENNGENDPTYVSVLFTEKIVVKNLLKTI